MKKKKKKFKNLNETGNNNEITDIIPDSDGIFARFPMSNKTNKNKQSIPLQCYCEIMR